MYPVRTYTMGLNSCPQGKMVLREPLKLDELKLVNCFYNVESQQIDSDKPHAKSSLIDIRKHKKYIFVHSNSLHAHITPDPGRQNNPHTIPINKPHKNMRPLDQQAFHLNHKLLPQTIRLFEKIPTTYRI